jgi:hypothetical protein
MLLNCVKSIEKILFFSTTEWNRECLFEQHHVLIQSLMCVGCICLHNGCCAFFLIVLCRGDHRWRNSSVAVIELYVCENNLWKLCKNADHHLDTRAQSSD